MVSGIDSIGLNEIQPQSFQRQRSSVEEGSNMLSFEQEDEAIISSQAKLLNELEKFNSGADNLVDLIVQSELTKITVEAAVNVIQVKKDMFDEILNMVE